MSEPRPNHDELVGLEKDEVGASVRSHEDSVQAWIVDPVEQLRELADLMRRGLLSREEFERHKAKVIGT